MPKCVLKNVNLPHNVHSVASSLFFDLKILNISVRALIDTGSAITFINLKQYFD